MSWYEYEDGRAQRQLQAKDIERRRQRGERMEPVTAPKSGHIARTFWGKAWCTHLEEHADYEHRLPRGRSYLRSGCVYNLEIQPGVITSQVSGSRLYEVRVNIRPLTPDHWNEIKQACSGGVTSLLDLLGGRIGDNILKVLVAPESGLFPGRREISFSCSCPDWADMCKHVAATLYGVGVMLDDQPELFFRLRSVDPTELIQNTRKDALEFGPSAESALAGEDLSALFGIELAPDPSPAAEVEAPLAPAPAMEKAAASEKKLTAKVPGSSKPRVRRKSA